MLEWKVVGIGSLVTLALLAGPLGAGAVQGGGALSPDYLDKLLAPVAPYPDQLLAQVLRHYVATQRVYAATGHDGARWAVRASLWQRHRDPRRPGRSLVPGDHPGRRRAVLRRQGGPPAVRVALDRGSVGS